MALARQTEPIYTEPYGSVFTSHGQGVRSVVRSNPSRHPPSTRRGQCVDHRTRREIPDDPHGHEEARASPRGRGVGEDGEGWTGTCLPIELAPVGGRGRLDPDVRRDGGRPSRTAREFPRAHQRRSTMSAATKSPKAARTAKVTTPTDREIRIERVFDAPRDRVWKAFTDPQLVAQWWGRGNK